MMALLMLGFSLHRFIHPLWTFSSLCYLLATWQRLCSVLKCYRVLIKNNLTANHAGINAMLFSLSTIGLSPKLPSWYPLLLLLSSLFFFSLSPLFIQEVIDCFSLAWCGVMYRRSDYFYSLALTPSGVCILELACFIKICM